MHNSTITIYTEGGATIELSYTYEPYEPQTRHCPGHDAYAYPEYEGWVVLRDGRRIALTDRLIRHLSDYVVDWGDVAAEHGGLY